MNRAATSIGPQRHEAPLGERERDCVLGVLAGLDRLPGALLPILHAIQDALGWLPPASVPLIAHALNISRAEVHGVLGFYHDFRREPPARHVLRICRAEACQAMGARELEAHVHARLGSDRQAAGVDPAITLEPVYCLGNCACAPSLMLDGAVHGRVTIAAVDRLLDACTAPA